jgi:hypothetical protein
VSPNPGTAVPTGQVVFGDGRTLILGVVTLDSTGSAVFTTATLPVGIHQIRAYYFGPAGFLASESPTLRQFVLDPGPRMKSGQVGPSDPQPRS